MPARSPCYDSITVSYAAYKATYAIVPLREDCPPADAEARDSAVESAVGKAISDGKDWCKSGRCTEDTCLPTVTINKAKPGKAGSEPMDNGTHKRCYIEVELEAEIECQCQERVAWPDVPSD